MNDDNFTDSDFESMVPSPQSDINSELGEYEYIVEKIRDIRALDGINMYLVKWEGYDEETWEPEDNMKCDELIEKYFEDKGTRRIPSMKASTFCRICNKPFRTRQALSYHNRIHINM